MRIDEVLEKIFNMRTIDKRITAESLNQNNEKLKKIYLMHISKDNNTPELAYNSLYEILERENKSHLEIEIINEEGTEIYKI